MVRGSVAIKPQALRLLTGEVVGAPWRTGWKRAWTVLAGMAKLVRVWHERARQRQDLMAMSRASLRDIGLTSDEVYREARKAFWQA